MLFNSFQFVLFFPVVVCLFFAIPPRYRWILLLAASYYFYACWRVEYLALLAATTVVDYLAARWMDRSTTQQAKRRILLLSLVSNLGVLFYFKYLTFFSITLHQLNLFTTFPELRILLPVGISFYTFQSLSYTIEVYRGTIPAEKNLGVFAAYVAFFPQLVAGPIERPGELLPQFRQRHAFDRQRVLDGLRLMLWGFFKKIVIADRLSYYVNAAYNDVAHHDGQSLLLATYFFAFQIFCDFSGYTDIARGSARVMGFELMVNFSQPYLASSIRDFWGRWHISLSSWFRDYLYIPLGGNRVSRLKWYRNLFITFLVSGLWHGANWTFVLWGALHGVYLIVGAATKDVRDWFVAALGLDRLPRLRNGLSIVVTFHLVLVGWILFRANTLADALTVIGKISAVPATMLNHQVLSAPFDNQRDFMFLLLILSISAFHQARRWREEKWLGRSWWSTGFVALQFWFIVVFGVFDNKQFIYFQF